MDDHARVLGLPGVKSSVDSSAAVVINRPYERRRPPVKMLSEMFTMAPGNKDHQAALRCAVSVFVPLITLVLLDRLDLAIFASFGAFTGIYGRNEPHARRFGLQARAGSLMVAVMLLAALTARAGAAFSLTPAETVWLQVAATTLVAGGCSLTVAWWRLRPAGSLFHIFAFAAIASIPSQPPLWQGMVNYWAMVAAVVPLVGHTTRHRVSRGLQRIVGTVAGLVLLAGVLILQPAPWQAVLIIAACQFGAEMFIARQYLLAQVFVTPLALISTLLVVPAAPGPLLRDRIADTVIGAAVGIAVVLAPTAWRRLGSGHGTGHGPGHGTGPKAPVPRPAGPRG
jgi:uncharacterized membrane protein YccC